VDLHAVERHPYLKNMMDVMLILMKKGKITARRVIHNVSGL